MSPSAPRDERQVLAAVFTLSAAMLMLEVALTRALSVAQFHHFSFLVVSLALLGLGAAGSLLAAWPALGRRPEWAAVGFTASAAAMLGVLKHLPFDSYAVAWDVRQVGALVTTVLACAAPFLMAGIALGAYLAAQPSRAHVVYGSNLTGSALGAVAALPLLSRTSPEAVVLISAALGLCAFSAAASAEGARRGPLAGVGGAIVLMAVALAAPALAAASISPYKALPQALLHPGARHTVRTWDDAGRVDVVESQAIHALPGLSLAAGISRPPLQAGLMVDGDNLAPITALDPDSAEARQIGDHVPEAMGAALRPGGSWLVLETGGGWPVLMALAGGASSVEAVERSRAVVDAVGGDYGEWTFGLLDDERVTLTIADVRTRIRRHDRRFDVVLFPLRDGYHPVTSGAYSLGEDYRLTVESVEEALDMLRPGGMIVASRWLQTPPSESLRLAATMIGALRRRGITEPERHLAAIRSMRTIAIAASPTPLTGSQRDTVRRFASTRSFDLVWLADLDEAEINRFQRLPDDVYHEGLSNLLADPDAFVDRYAFDVRPVTDDRPFPNHYFRWRQTRDVMAGLRKSWQPFGGSGYLVLLLLLALAAVLATTLVMGPLVVRRATASPPSVASLAYFAAIGIGYMFVLVPFSQRAILYLGHPARGLAIVSATLLVFGGLGSLSARRWQPGRALAILIVTIAVAGPLVGSLWRASLGWPLEWRVLLCCASLAPLGFLMGVPLPAALERTAHVGPGAIPWGWAVNGCASVVAGILAAMIALSWGFGAVIAASAAAYAAAWVTWPRLPAPD